MASLVSKDRLGTRMVLASPPWGRRERGQCAMDASARANGSRFGLGGLVPGRVVGFGGRVRGGKSSTNEKPRIHEWTMCKWEWFQTGWACPCGGFWVLAGVAVGLDG